MITTSQHVESKESDIKSGKKILKPLWILACVNTLALVASISLMCVSIRKQNSIKNVKNLTKEEAGKTVKYVYLDTAKPGVKEELETVFEHNFRKNHDVHDMLKFPLPEKYRNNISSYSGYREALSVKDTGGIELKGNLHYGIDYACPDKTPVYAAADGYVTTVYPSFYNGPKWKGDSVFGGLIIIHHFDGSSTVYAHLSYTMVSEGTYVGEGTNIGWTGGVKGRRGSGASTGPHLHFARYYDLPTQFK